MDQMTPLFKFPKAAFDPETIAVQADDCFRGQSQTGAYKNALRIPILHKYETEHLVQLLSPKQIDTQIFYLRLLSVQLPFCSLVVAVILLRLRSNAYLGSAP